MIETKNLTKTFDNFTAVDSLDLKIETGEFFGLLGPNGAGKTTTISLLSTLLLPTKGFLAILALKSGHPFAFLLAALVFIVDGSLGILKISFKRFLHISILRNTLTPLHDHVRKRLGWSDEQVVARWLILQAVASALLLLMVR